MKTKIVSSASCHLLISTDSKTVAAPYSLIADLETRRGLLTVEEVAAMLRKSECTIYRLAQRKQLPSMVIGGSRLFDPATLAVHFARKNPEMAVAAKVQKAAA